MTQTTKQGQRKAGTTRRTKTTDKAKVTVEAVETAAQEATPQADREMGKVAKVLPTPTEALATAKQDNPSRYEHVLRVTEQSKDGSPKRVVIACSDKQYKQAPDGTLVSGCEGEREIATQDLFQVTSCAWCADRKVRKARRNRAKSRDKALRAQAKAMRGA